MADSNSTDGQQHATAEQRIPEEVVNKLFGIRAMGIAAKSLIDNGQNVDEVGCAGNIAKLISECASELIDWIDQKNAEVSHV